MTDTKKLLEQRIKAKKKKPAFVIKDSKIKSRVPTRWRKPRGKHSPVRQHHKGRPKMASPGYGSPKAVKHLHASGLSSVIVKNKNELEQIDSTTQGVIISGKIGNKKRIELIKLAAEKNIQILNLTDSQKHLEKLELQFKERKASQQQKSAEKEKKEAEKKKKAAEKEAKEEKEKEDNKEGAEEKTTKTNAAATTETKETTKTSAPKPTKLADAETKQKKEQKEMEKTIIKKQ